MTPQEVEAILNGTHGDPFAVLGPHETDNCWEVRAFLPQAMDAALVVKGATHAMRKTRSEGFFIASIPHDPGAYQLRLTLWNGSQTDIDDPYRFPRLISDFDLHIHGEGTQYESYRTM